MAFDKKAYNRWYYQQHKEYWQNLNGRPVSSRKRRNTIGNYVDDYVKSVAENRKANTSSDHGQRNTIGNYVDDYVKSVAENRIDPTWRDKMNAAYANASYKRGRRSPTRVSNQTIHNYFQEKEQAYADKVKAQINRHKQEEKRSYATGKATLRKGTNYAQGKIPAALKSYGSNWLTGAKSIGRSAKKLPSKVSKKLNNFYKKWLKW